VESIIRPVLELHGRSDKIELFLYQDKFPQAMVWQGCVLVISDALASSLNDDELAGIVAHEMGHAYFMIETIKARKRGDREATRIVELKCDAVAMLSLKLLGHDPADHLRGLRRVDDLTRINGYNTLGRDHPSIGERTRFAQTFIKLLA
jgi:Zn-dependent protease with chaperone function